MAGTTAQQISRLERGERQLTIAWIERLAAALQCEPSDFIQDTESARLADLAQRLDAIEDLLLRICHHFGVDT